jgi:predicted Zn-dependent protease
LIGILALVLVPSFAFAAPAKDDAVVRKAMDEEMQRSMQKLKLGTEAPPYYMSYTIVDEDTSRVSARLGQIVIEDHNPSRAMRVDVRVGSYDEDNTNSRSGFGGHGSGMISRDDDYVGIRRDLWEMTDHQYKAALEALARKKASKTIESADKDKMPDFAKVTPVNIVTDKATPQTDADRAKVRDAVAKLSALFREFPTVTNGRVDGGLGFERRRMLTSEKTWTDERQSRVRIDVYAETTTPDGHRLSASTTFAGPDVASLPPLDKMLAETRALAKNLADQRTAPAVEAGAASVVFEGQAAAHLARMMLAQPLSGQPEPKSADTGPRDGSMSFAEKIGLRIAPTWLSVSDDPTALGPTKKPLAGSYDTDDEGVPGEKLTLIDHGTVKTLFMSRTPRKEIPKSNGHGRGGWGARASFSNLIVTADNALPRAALLAAAQRSAGPKGTVYIVKQLDPSSGLGRGTTLRARVAFRLKDGKEEPVRDLSLEGFMPKKMKKDLVAAGTDSFLYEEEGTTPYSIRAPSLLFEDVDVSKPNDKSRIPPLYASPLESGGK